MSDKGVALFFLNLDILTEWKREPRVTFIPKQTMKRFWNTKYGLPSLLYHFHYGSFFFTYYIVKPWPQTLSPQTPNKFKTQTQRVRPS